MHIRSSALRAVAWITVCAALIPATLVAQQPTPPEEVPPRLEGDAQATLLATTGNSSSQALGVGGRVVWRPLPWRLEGKAAFAQTETDEVLSARSTVAMFRADRLLSPRMSVYGQYDFLRDLFAGIEQRNSITGGIAYRVLATAPHLLTVDGGIGFEHESRLAEESEDRGIATGGLEYRWAISETSELVEELRYIQAFEAIDDFKLNQSIGLTAALTSVLSLKFANIVRYVNEPVPGFESTDTITSVALVLKFKRPGP
jgi:putative salt-induced outer membrane protein